MQDKSSSKNMFSLPTVILLGMNAVIGSGTFTMPLSLVKSAGPAGMLSVLLASVCVLIMALGFARIATLLPEGGGFYAYVSSWAGRLPGLVVTAFYLVGLTIALAFLSGYVSAIIGVYSPGINQLYTAYAVIGASVVMNFFASSIAAAGQTILFILTILPLLFVGYLGAKGFSFQNFYPFFTQGWKGIISCIPNTLFAFLGFESIMALARRVHNPAKTIAIATIATISLCSLVYLLFVGLVIGGIPQQLLLEKTTLPEALMYALPDAGWLVHFISVSIIITVVGTIYAMTFALSEMLISCVEKFTDSKIRLSEILSLIIIGLAVCAFLAFCGDINKLVSWVALFVVIAYMTSLATLFFKGQSCLDKILGVLCMASSTVFLASAIIKLL